MSYQSDRKETEDTGMGAPTPAYNEKKAKKDLHVAFFIILCILTGLAGFAAFLNFCMTMSQLSSSTNLPNGTTVWLSENYSCNDVKEFWPLRWGIANWPDNMINCPWPVGNTTILSLMSIAGMGAIVMFIFVLKKPEIRWLNWTVSNAIHQIF